MKQRSNYAVVVTVMVMVGGGLSWRVLAEEPASKDMCAEHPVAEAICPFCHPELIKEHGFCSGHGVPEALCTTCRPSLVEAFKAEGDWCAEHGVPESQCEACHPGIKERWQQADSTTKKRDAGRLWCREHDVYEDECFICHPELKNASGKPSSGELMCNEHRVPERECGICQPHLAPGLKPGESLKVRTVSPDSAARAGIRTENPTLSEVSPHVKVLGEVRYNQNRLARITPLAAGVVQRVLVDVGQVVKAGDVLVEIASSDVAEAKRDYVVAMMDEHLKELAYDREKQMLAKAISPEQNFQQAESEHERAKIVRMTARQRLANLGFTDEEIARIEETKSSSSLLVVRAPYAGTLVERAAVVGEAVEPGKALFTLADLSTMWVELAVPEGQASRVKTGLPVRATFQGLGDEEVAGELTWVHSQVDKRTRLIKARAEVPNLDGQLRDGMFGEVRVILGEDISTLRIPKESVQRIEQKPYVLVRTADDLFDLRRVVVGERNGKTVEIVSGIQLADAVVVDGAFIMKSEFFKSRLGAGCVDD
ncbi:MAG TPA: efflux RND transporter periplasmic adaptor subunit [Phycisphaerae bacterium]|nr:efflux RND transporter periplasmic adaptor subunit [Phycisphaerae bacterium]